MSDKYVLAIDAGSGGGRANIVDLRGNLVSSACEDWGYDVPADAGPMAKEFVPKAFWDVICRLIREAIAKIGIPPGDVIAVSAASQRQGMVFLDEEGHELYGGPNTDIRAIIEGFTIDGEFGSEVYGITGHTPSLLFTPARLEWFKTNRPEVYERIATVMSIGDWIIFRLSGQRRGEASCASGIGLVELSDVTGPRRLAEILNLPEGICPDIAGHLGRHRWSRHPVRPARDGDHPRGAGWHRRGLERFGPDGGVRARHRPQREDLVNMPRGPQQVDCGQ